MCGASAEVHQTMATNRSKQVLLVAIRIDVLSWVFAIMQGCV